MTYGQIVTVVHACWIAVKWMILFNYSDACDDRFLFQAPKNLFNGYRDEEV